MANIRKSFNFRNGLQVDNDKFVVNPNGLVGIGTSNPENYSLSVHGDTKIVGIITTKHIFVEQNVISLGKIGIHTADPTSKFHISGIGVTNPSGIDAGNRIRIGDFHWDNTYTSIHAKKISNEWWLEQNSPDNDGTDLIFYKSRGLPNQEEPVQVGDNLFRLTARAYKPNGVGIGTTISLSDYNGDYAGQIIFDVDSIDGNNVASSIDVKTAGQSRLIVKGDGKVGIGTNLPAQKLDVIGNTYVSNSVGIRSTAPTEALDVNGNIKSSGTVTATTFSGNLPTTDLSGTITNTQLAGSITNDKLAGFITNNKLVNDSVSFGGVSLDLGSSDATPAFDLTDATNYPYTSLTGITTSILGDTTPQLGGDLNVNGNDISGTGNVNLTGVVTATSFVGDGSGLTSIQIVTDTTPQLGGNLDINSKDITGTGNINVTGIITSTTFSGNVDLSGLLKEGVNITAGKLSDNTNIDLVNGMLHLFTTTESTTSTPNIRVDASTSLDSSMSVGEAITVVLITTAANAGYSAQLTIDGSAVTESWIGGTAPSTGNSSGYDVYSYNIIKTGSASFVALATLSNFA